MIRSCMDVWCTISRAYMYILYRNNNRLGLKCIKVDKMAYYAIRYKYRVYIYDVPRSSVNKTACIG